MCVNLRNRPRGRSHWLAYTLQHGHITRTPVTLCSKSRGVVGVGAPPVLGTTEPTLRSKDCARARQQSSHGVGDSYAFYASKCQAELEEEKERRRRMRRTLQGRRRVFRMTLSRERKRRRKGREILRTMSMMDRMVCTPVLPRRKKGGEQAEKSQGGVRRLGDLRLPERRARLVASSLSAGDVVAEKRLWYRSAVGKVNESEPGMS